MNARLVLAALLLARCAAAAASDTAPALPGNLPPPPPPVNNPPPPASSLIPVWPGVAPGSENVTFKEVDDKMPWGDHVIRDVVNPTLQPFTADAAKNSGTAVIVAPGGAFAFLNIDAEGTEVAKWLQARGVNAFVLRYRLSETPEGSTAFMFKLPSILGPIFSGPEKMLASMQENAPRAIADGRQAIQYLRAHAADYKLDPQRIVFLGFSAGGVVATDLALHHDAATRANHVALVYPGPWTLDKVPDDAAPLFVVSAADDKLIETGAKPMVNAWKAANKPVQFQIYDKGGHGFGMKKQNLPSDHWIDDLGAWLDGQGLLKPAAAK